MNPEDERLIEAAEFKVCTCIAINHDHKPYECEEPPTYRGGTCVSCRLWAHHLKEQKGEA